MYPFAADNGDKCLKTASSWIFLSILDSNMDIGRVVGIVWTIFSRPQITPY